MDVHLEMSWGISRGRETYGYNICRLVDTSTGKRYRCMGGGYDMQGTVFADWLQETFQTELLGIKERATQYLTQVPGEPWERVNNDSREFYGMTWYRYADGTEKVSMDGACGLSSIERIARDGLGLKVRHLTNRNGHLVGLIVSD